MTNINVFDDRTTQDLLTLVRMLRAGMFGASMMAGRNQIDTTAEPIYFTNDSGEAIPPYACMQVTGTEEIGNQNYLVVDKPADTDGTAGGYLFNGPRTIAIDSEGIAQVEQVVRAFKDAGTVTGGEKWTPVVNQWYIAQDDDGPFICCGSDDIDTDVLKVFSQGVGGGGTGDTHYLLTLTAAVSSGSGTATIRNMADDTETATGVTVIDNLGNSDGYAIGKRGICVKQGDAYYILSMGRYVTDVRWDDPDLEQSRDGGASYSNIDTAVDCS